MVFSITAKAVVTLSGFWWKMPLIALMWFSSILVDLAIVANGVKENMNSIRTVNKFIPELICRLLYIVMLPAASRRKCQACLIASAYFFQSANWSSDIQLIGVIVNF